MMKTEQKNTKKIVVIIVAVLAILLAVAGLTFWSVRRYRERRRIPTWQQARRRGIPYAIEERQCHSIRLQADERQARRNRFFF